MTISEVWSKKKRPFVCKSLGGATKGSYLLVTEWIDHCGGQFNVWNGEHYFMQPPSLPIEHLSEIDTIGKAKRRIRMTSVVIEDLKARLV